MQTDDPVVFGNFNYFPDTGDHLLFHWGTERLRVIDFIAHDADILAICALHMPDRGTQFFKILLQVSVHRAAPVGDCGAETGDLYAVFFEGAVYATKFLITEGAHIPAVHCAQIDMIPPQFFERPDLNIQIVRHLIGETGNDRGCAHLCLLPACEILLSSQGQLLLPL